ncbi:tetratricopeptide repeat protein [Viscerimonas tarda]
MEEKDVSDLVRRYEQMLESGKSIYFDAEEFDDLAEYYDMLDDLETAKKLVDSGLKIHPGNQSLLLKSARFVIYSGQYREALEYLNKTFDGYDFELYLLKIECLLNLDLYSEANLLAEEVLNDDETDEEVIFAELGFLYEESDYYDDAISFFEQSLAFEHTNIEVLAELSYAYEMCDNFALAVDATNKILDIDPYSYEAWTNMGKLYSLQGQYEKAIDAFDFALTIDDSDADLLKLKAHCFSLCNRTDEAIALFEECIVLNPEDESLYYSLSDCYFSLELYDDMLCSLNRYEKLHGKTAEIFAKKALAYLQKEEMEQACLLMQSGMEIDPESEDLNIVAGEFYFRLGEYAKSEVFFLKTYGKEQDDRVMLDRLSLISIAKNDIDKAIEYTESLEQVAPDHSTKIRLALLYFEVGDRQKFNEYLNTFNDEELKLLTELFFSDENFVLPTITREALISKLNDARECRQLFKNIVY